MYDEDYKNFIHHNFVSSEVTTEPWKLKPPIVVDTLEKVAEAYYYTHYRLKWRYITPRTRTFLEQFHKSLETYLEKPEDIKRQSSPAILSCNTSLRARR